MKPKFMWNLLGKWGRKFVQMVPVIWPRWPPCPYIVKTLIFFSRAKTPMTLKLGMQHRVLEYYQVCSNDDAALTLTYFTARSNLVPYAFVWEKGKTMDFSETIVVHNVKVGKWLHKPIWISNVKVIHWPWTKITQIQYLFFFFPLETAKLIGAKFHLYPQWDGGTKIWPIWPPCSYMVKTLKNLLWNQKADDPKTWYAASGARVLPSLFKWWPWVDLDLFYGKVKFGPLCFCMGKR